MGCDTFVTQVNVTQPMLNLNGMYTLIRLPQQVLQRYAYGFAAGVVKCMRYLIQSG